MPEKLPLLFSEAFDAPVWEMHFQSGSLLISTRDEDKKEVAFTLFDLHSKTFCWRDLIFEEPWWVGVTHITDDHIVFHTFQDSKDFQKKSIFGFDAERKEVVWVLEGYEPVERLKEGLLCYKKEGDALSHFLIEYKTGEVSPVVDQKMEIKKNEFKSISLEAIYPFHYLEETSSFDSVARFLKLKHDINIVGACDYMEHKERVIISFFEKSGELFRNLLIVLNGEGHLIHQESIAEDLKGLAHDTFFIASEALIFVKNRSRLKGLLIED